MKDPNISELSKVENFDPEHIPIYVLEGKKMICGYSICTQIQTPENSVYVDYDHFTQERTNMQLIHMMTAFAIKAMSQGYTPSYEGIIEITRYDDKVRDVATITLTFRELCEELDKSILKKNPLYANYSDPGKVRNVFYDTYVSPYLISDEIDGEEAGE